MIKIEQPIIVEGKYDKITLENVVDGLILTTEGFGIFKNREKCEIIRRLAARSGVIVITDSDGAGNLIRAHIKKIVGNGRITNVYIPQLAGKEKRKGKPSKEGLLGLEGMRPEQIEQSLDKYGVTGRTVPENRRKITKTDLFVRGLSGCEGSAERRRELMQKLSLPGNLSPNALLDILNTILTYEEFAEVTDEWLQRETKS